MRNFEGNFVKITDASKRMSHFYGAGGSCEDRERQSRRMPHFCGAGGICEDRESPNPNNERIEPCHYMGAQPATIIGAMLR